MANPTGDVVAPSGNPAIDGLIEGSAWTFAPGSGRTITYTLNVFNSTTDNTWVFPPFIDSVRSAFTAWSNVANVRFQELGIGGVFTQSTADIAVTLAGTLLPTVDSLFIVAPPTFASGNALLDYLALTRQQYARPEGDMFFDNADLAWEYVGVGSFGYELILGSIGYALGLKGPFDDGPTFDELGIGHLATTYHTIMSAQPMIEYPQDGLAASPMPLDILAIQYIYGANTTYHAGNDTYELSNTTPFVTLWDAGGDDTIDASETHLPGSVDLREGHVSLLARPVFAIAYNATIENAIGNAAANTIIGNNAANRLDGGGGLDTLQGGNGNDTYAVDSTDDVIVESAGEGMDGVLAAGTYRLSSNVENLTFVGARRAEGTGNELDNVIVGNATDNILNGGPGNDFVDGGQWADTMRGGPGDDTYVVSQFNRPLDPTVMTLMGDERSHLLQGETRRLLPGEGISIDPVDANGLVVHIGAWTLIVGAPVGQALVAGTYTNTDRSPGPDHARFDLWGEGRGSGELIGTLTVNVFDVDYSGTSPVLLRADMTFSAQEDTGSMWGSFSYNYVGPRTPELVIEVPDEGIDTVRSSIDYTLPGNVENLALTGNGNRTGKGNELGNALIGNSGNNNLDGRGGSDSLDGGSGNDTLNGGTGIDQMSGGAGSDTYIVDNTADTVTESASAGTDTVRSAYAHTLGANVENLVLTGNATRGTGNTLANALTGNTRDNTLSGGAGNDSLDGGSGNDTLDGGSGNDTLHGGLGIDRMAGGAGNDLYVANNSSDVATENAREGRDHVQAGGVRYTLGANVENLTLTGSAGDGTGNSLNNVITGNSVANQLVGGAGNDTMNGGVGNDTLAGGSGNDRFIFDATLNGTTNVDVISDFYPVRDALRLDDVVFTGLPLGTLAASAFRSGTQARDSSDRIIYNAGTGAVLFDSDGTGAAGAVRFATLDAGLAITASDFVVV